MNIFTNENNPLYDIYDYNHLYPFKFVNMMIMQVLVHSLDVLMAS